MSESSSSGADDERRVRVVPKVGRERRYRLRGGRLGEVYDWLARYERSWRSGDAPPAGPAGPSHVAG